MYPPEWEALNVSEIFRISKPFSTSSCPALLTLSLTITVFYLYFTEDSKLLQTSLLNWLSLHFSKWCWIADKDSSSWIVLLLSVDSFVFNVFEAVIALIWLLCGLVPFSSRLNLQERGGCPLQWCSLCGYECRSWKKLHAPNTVFSKLPIACWNICYSAYWCEPP